jgi:hypothetical protein
MPESANLGLPSSIFAPPSQAVLRLSRSVGRDIGFASSDGLQIA